MRALWVGIAATLCLFAASACSTNKSPPTGRWEGVYDAPDAMAAVRLEISSKGEIFLSAPNALDLESVPADARPAMHQRLADELSSGWSDVHPRTLDFDGHVFRKPGGIAPQLEWNPDSKVMTVVLYLGLRSGIRIPLRAVSVFSNDPWMS